MNVTEINTLQTFQVGYRTKASNQYYLQLDLLYNAKCIFKLCIKLTNEITRALYLFINCCKWIRKIEIENLMKLIQIYNFNVY